MKEHTLILLYHQFDEGKNIQNRPDRKLIVSQNEFCWQLDYLSHNYSFIGISDFVRQKEQGQKAGKNQVIITIDDGHYDNYIYAFPVLKRYSVPAIIYLCTGWINGIEKPWRLDVVSLLQSQTELKFEWKKKEYIFKLNSVKEVQYAYSQLSCLIVHEYDEQRETLLNVLNECGLKKRSNGKLFLSWSDILKMYQAGIEFGAHTITHPLLAQITENQMKKEIFRSVVEIEKKIGFKVEHFAYPYGGENAAQNREFNFCKTIGLKSAVTTQRGICLDDCYQTKLLSLPRLSVNGIWNISEFIEQVRTIANE